MDREYILNGVRHGFDIIEPNANIQIAHMNNYKSATCYENKKAVEMQIKQELAEGRYKVVEGKPQIVSALGAICKPGSTTEIRLIHDASMPKGIALNDYSPETEKQKYQTIKDAVDLLPPNAFLAKVDLTKAYRSVKISKYSQKATGLAWTFEGESKETYFIDEALPFGSKLGPYIFTRLTQAVRRMMARRGYHVVAYLDDFLICEQTKEQCNKALNTLIHLLRDLGFAISYSKVIMPTQKLCFLGVNICSVTFTLELPEEKVNAFKDLLSSFGQRRRATLKQLQQLAGKLNWASQVVLGGRTYLRRILDLMRPLKQASHKVKLNEGFKADIQWWIDYFQVFNAKRLALRYAPVHQVSLDACTLAGGAYYNGDWQYAYWATDYPHIKDMHINNKEIYAGLIAARRWGNQWKNSKVVFYTDNTTARAAFDKGTTRSELAMRMVRELIWLSAMHNFEIVGLHIPGYQNVLPDTISRLHQPGFLPWLACMLGFNTHKVNISNFISLLHNHMSFQAFYLLFPQIQKYAKGWMKYK